MQNNNITIGNRFNWLQNDNTFVIELEQELNNKIEWEKTKEKLTLPSDNENIPYDFKCVEIEEAEILILGYLHSLNKKVKEQHRRLNYGII